MSEQKSLKINALMNMTNQVSGVLFPLITFAYVARVLLPEGIGKVNFAQATVGIFVMIASLGIPLYGTREVAKVRDDKQKLSQLVIELFLLNVAMTIIGFSAFGIYVAFSEKAATDPLLFWICTLPMLLAPAGFNYLFNGLEDFTFITVSNIILRIIVLPAYFLFIDDASDYLIYALITGLSAVGANIINLYFVKKHLKLGLVQYKKLKIWRHLRPTLLIFTLGAVISIYTAMDKIMLGYLTNESEVGYYTVADKLIKVVVMLVTTLGIVLLPRASYCLEKNQIEEYGRLSNFSLRTISFLALPVTAGVFVLATPMVNLLSGEAFAQTSILVKIMIFNIIFIALSNFIGFQVLYPHNKERLIVASVMLGAVINFGLNWFLIPRWQAVGAAVATLIAEASVTTVQLILSRPYQKFTWPLISIWKYSCVSLLMGFSILLIMPLFGTSFIQIFACTAIGGIIYLVFMLRMRDQVIFKLLGMFPRIEKKFN